MMLDLKKLCTQHKIEPRGVIHIGAHEGTELTTYQNMRISKILFIEANPPVFERLKANVAGAQGVRIVNCAISNQNGVASLHVTSMDQSSSILPLKLHKDIYPSIRETHNIEVPSRKLDTLLEELQIAPSDYNIINIDIQGAELLAFQGAKNLLRHIEAINTEVNYEELYEGCALINQIDEFLETFGFVRVSTTTPYHPSWGDAFYVRRTHVSAPEPVITMSTLGSNGRFANQIFQYAFLKIYGKEHNCRVEAPEWIGRYLFGHKDKLVSRKLPVIRILLPQNKIAQKFPDAMIVDNPEPLLKDSGETLKNSDLWGYFQFNTRYYAPYKEYFVSLFQPVSEIKVKMEEALGRLRSKGKTIVGLHLRRRDYGYGPFFIAPTEWYMEWLDRLWGSLDRPVLFVASDDPAKVLKDFERYCPVTSTDLGIECSQAEFYPDFYLLTQCDIVAISNSSYSFAACMLNENCKVFVRPHLPSRQLIPFDPWSSEVLLYDEGIVDTAEKYLQHGDTKNLLSVCKDITKTHPHDVIRLGIACINSLELRRQVSDEACFIVGSAFRESGQLDAALHYFDEALRINPNNAEAQDSMKQTLHEKRCLRKDAMRFTHEIPVKSHPDVFKSVYKENCQQLSQKTFIACAMFTPNKPKFFQYADRLAMSCEKFGLPYIIFEVPGIHKSITPGGQDNLDFTKANLIYFNMLTFPQKNILYLDVDVFFVKYPDVIETVCKRGYDFAIYNWLNDEHNEAYIDLNHATGKGNMYSHLYAFSHNIPYTSSRQLICSGAVQFYRNSLPARYLLETWHSIIANNPDYADDESMDYTFNNFIVDTEDLKPFWLDKSYCRYPWWPHIKPVIVHPELPCAARNFHLTEISGGKRFYPEMCKPNSNTFVFPQDCVIDTKKQRLLKIRGGQVVDSKPIRQKFYIYSENFGLARKGR